MDQTTKSLKSLVKDCQITTQSIVDLSQDVKTDHYNSIKDRWDFLVASQEAIHEELALMILKKYEDKDSDSIVEMDHE